MSYYNYLMPLSSHALNFYSALILSTALIVEVFILTVNLGCGRPDSSQPDRRHDIFAKRVGVILFFLCILTIPSPQAKHNTHLKHELAKNKHSGVYFFFSHRKTRHGMSAAIAVESGIPLPVRQKCVRQGLLPLCTIIVYSSFLFCSIL